MRNMVFALAAVLGLAGCGNDARDPAPPPGPTASQSPKSIFRPEFQQEAEPEKRRLEPFEARISFPEGAELTEAALAKIGEAMASPQFEAGGAIVLRGHSDAGGGDEVNLRVSQDRAEAVRDWFIEQDVPEERITVIAFGEQNPVAPNALPDGTPDEAGRARNRRVDITIAVAAPPPQAEEPSLAETLSETGGNAEEPPDSE